LASAAGGAASGGTAALIQGGDVGQSIIIGGAGGAGASVARELAAAAEYDVPAFSDQSRQLVSQDVGVNRFSDIGADVGTALGRAAITGDVEG
jgi:nucleoside-diphosphate-sugar epimerase